MPTGAIPSPIAVIPVTPPSGSGQPSGALAISPPAAQPPVAQPLAGSLPRAAAPTGSITGDTDKFVETQILAVLAARRACETLAKKLLGSRCKITTLIINNGLDKTAIANYKSLTVLLKAIDSAYHNMVAEADVALTMRLAPVALAADSGVAGTGLSSFAGALTALGLPTLTLPALTTGVQSIADFVSLFRTDTEFKNQQVSVNEQMVVTLLVPHILGAKADPACDSSASSTVKTIFYPGLYPMDETSPTTDSQLMKLITKLLEGQARGDGRSAECKNVLNALMLQDQNLGNAITALKNQFDAATDATTKSNLQNQITSKINERLPIQDKINRLRQSAANLDALKASTTSFITLLTNIDTATQMTLLAPLLRVERLQNVLSNDGTYALDLTVMASGTTRIRRNLFFNAKAAHSGGVSVSARLFDKRGALVMGEVVNHYIEFTDSRQIHDLAEYKWLAGD